MRLRNIKDQYIKVEEHPKVIKEPENLKGKWKESYFHNHHPIYVEFGMGKGQFLNALATHYPNRNFIGFEKFTKVLIRALEKFDDTNNNVALIRMDAEAIEEVFAEGEVERIYLNFSDPWPKDRHHKRRLTNERFLTLYKKVLKEKGEVHFKTDNVTLFDYSIEEFERCGWTLKNVTRDLHEEEALEENFMTEYEERYRELGQPIYRLEAIRP